MLSPILDLGSLFVTELTARRSGRDVGITAESWQVSRENEKNNVSLSKREKNQKSHECHGWPIFRLQLICFLSLRAWLGQARRLLTLTTPLKKHPNGMYK